MLAPDRFFEKLDSFDQKVLINIFGLDIYSNRAVKQYSYFTY